MSNLIIVFIFYYFLFAICQEITTKDRPNSCTNEPNPFPMNKKTFSNPTTQNLQIPGELIKLEVFFNSFHVTYQFHIVTHAAAELDLFCNIYPIRHLQDFFKANSTLPLNHIAERHSRIIDQPAG